MAEVLFNKFFILIILNFFVLDFFFKIWYSPIISISKTIKLLNLQKIPLNINYNLYNNIYLLVYLIIIFSFKNSCFFVDIFFYSFLFFLIIVNFVWANLISFKSSNKFSYIIICIIFFLNFKNHLDSLLSFFFFIEIFSVFYYFFFLTSYNLSSYTVLRYKNGLLLLLWNNFLTTFFLFFSCFMVLKFTGTTSFQDLNILTNSYIFFFIIGLFWKVGLPIFHFFKLEVYRYLVRENIFLFSSLTIMINFFLLINFLIQPFILTFFFSFKVFVLIILFCLLLIVNNLKLSSLLHFFALSGVFTITTILTVLLI